MTGRNDFSPITRQVDALVAIMEDGGQVRLFGAWGGRFSVHVRGRRVEARVWERLLDRGDLDVFEDRANPNRAPRKYLVVTDQGRGRLLSHCSPDVEPL